MGAVGLEYAMFRYGFAPVGCSELSDLLIRLCMDEEENGNPDMEPIILNVAKALHSLRAISIDDDRESDDAEPRDADRPDNPDLFFIAAYERISKNAGEPVCDGDAWWEDFWPVDAPWHKHELLELARLKVGETISLRRALRAAAAKEAGDGQSKQ